MRAICVKNIHEKKNRNEGGIVFVLSIQAQSCPLDSFISAGKKKHDRNASSPANKSRVCGGECNKVRILFRLAVEQTPLKGSRTLRPHHLRTVVFQLDQFSHVRNKRGCFRKNLSRAAKRTPNQYFTRNELNSSRIQQT